MKTTLKKLTAILLGASLAASSVVCVFATEQKQTTDFSVKIVHTNDIHARVEIGRASCRERV